MESRNPVFNLGTLEDLAKVDRADTQVMTMQGSINKVGFLVSLTFFVGLLGFRFADSDLGVIGFFVSLLVCPAVAVFLVFRKTWAPSLAPLFAGFAGWLVGAFTFYAEAVNPGLSVHAFATTFSILFAVLCLYHVHALRGTERLTRMILVGAFSIISVYAFDLVRLAAFATDVLFLHQASFMGLAFSGFVIVIASLSFVLDFDMIEQAVEARAPKHMEWYAGFSILLTIVWLYLEILRWNTKLRK